MPKVGNSKYSYKKRKMGGAYGGKKKKRKMR